MKVSQHSSPHAPCLAARCPDCSHHQAYFKEIQVQQKHALNEMGLMCLAFFFFGKGESGRCTPCCAPQLCCMAKRARLACAPGSVQCSSLWPSVLS